MEIWPIWILSKWVQLVLFAWCEEEKKENGGEHLEEKVERGGEIASRGSGSACVSKDVSVFTICCSVIKRCLMKAGQDSCCMEGWPTLDCSPTWGSVQLHVSERKTRFKISPTGLTGEVRRNSLWWKTCCLNYCLFFSLLIASHVRSHVTNTSKLKLYTDQQSVSDADADHQKMGVNKVLLSSKQ